MSQSEGKRESYADTLFEIPLVMGSMFVRIRGMKANFTILRLIWEGTSILAFLALFSPPVGYSACLLPVLWFIISLVSAVF